MNVRIVIFDAAGRSLCGIDTPNGADHAAQWVLDTFARLALRGVTQAIAVELITDAVGDAAVRQITVGPDLTLEMRPGAGEFVEVVGMWRVGTSIQGGRQVEASVPNAQGWRVVHNTLNGATDLHAIAGGDDTLATRARAWRSLNPGATWLHRDEGEAK